MVIVEGNILVIHGMCMVYMWVEPWCFESNRVGYKWCIFISDILGWGKQKQTNKNLGLNLELKWWGHGHMLFLSYVFFPANSSNKWKNCS